MNNLAFVKLEQVDLNAMLDILNKESTRTHLIKHKVFDLSDVERWISNKLEVDAMAGCKVRAIELDGVLAGWCGIQQEQGEFELAVVIDEPHWGLGKHIFKEMMQWAVEMEHKTVFIHLLKTRRKYKFLEKVANEVSDLTLMGALFTSYELDVTSWK